MFALNLKNPRAAEPELDKKSLASLGMSSTSPVSAAVGLGRLPSNLRLLTGFNKEFSFRPKPAAPSNLRSWYDSHH